MNNAVHWVVCDYTFLIVRCFDIFTCRNSFGPQSTVWFVTGCGIVMCSFQFSVCLLWDVEFHSLVGIPSSWWRSPVKCAVFCDWFWCGSWIFSCFSWNLHPTATTDFHPPTSLSLPGLARCDVVRCDLSWRGVVLRGMMWLGFLPACLPAVRVSKNSMLRKCEPQKDTVFTREGTFSYSERTAAWNLLRALY
jgi:hypothetical protein